MNRNLITILTVNWRCPEFTRLLIGSAKGNPVVVVDNSPPSHLPGATVIPTSGDASHGGGINHGLRSIRSKYVLILDSDCHLLHDEVWQEIFFIYAAEYHVITVRGSKPKPIRPACVFMRTAEARRYDWRATEGYRGHRVTPDGFDVGIRAYREMVAMGLKILFMDTIKPSRYGTANGEEYALGGASLVYHHWHGNTLPERADDYPGVDLVADKDKLFSQLSAKKARIFI